METEFGSYPEAVRQAALEYARGLALGPVRPEPLPDAENVQFVLVGVRQAGRAILFASSSVTEAKFARQADGFDRVQIRPGGPVARVPRLTAIVGAKMTSFEQIVGEDYREALASLLDDWRRKQQLADEHQQRERRRRQRELEAGESL
jgi:hypothetical protein